VPGNHALRVGHGEQALASFLARYTLPANGMGELEGRWYAFRVGTVLFVSLSGDDVAYQDAAVPAGAVPAEVVPSQPGPPPAEAPPAASPVLAGAPGAGRGYSGGAQTRWLEATLAAARGDASLDWIVVQVHQCACSSATALAGSDLGIRRDWLPLFDTYEVDLVLSGHDYGYERSFPVRGYDRWSGTDATSGKPADTLRPHPVTTVDGRVFDTSQGTVHLVLGCAGTAGPAGRGEHGDQAGGGPAARLARVRTGPAGDAVEAATWSAQRDSSPGYGIAVFDVNPGSEAGGQTSITVRYYHDFHDYRATASDPVSPVAGDPNGDYAFIETFTLVRPRSDGRRWHPKA
jgi:3',5'-cyclic AMP phosphodiesterase CpdA